MVRTAKVVEATLCNHLHKALGPISSHAKTIRRKQERRQKREQKANSHTKGSLSFRCSWRWAEQKGTVPERKQEDVLHRGEVTKWLGLSRNFR